MQTLHIVTTCTNRKKRTVPPELHLRDVNGGSLGKRFRSWCRRLENTEHESLEAGALYSGGHWATALSLPSLASKGWHIRLWICSAGYGLISPNTPIRPYAATFATAHPDSVFGNGSDTEAAAAWWAELTQWAAPTGKPRSLRQLVEAAPNDNFLVVASLSYLRAIKADLVSAIRSLPRPDRLCVVSAGSRSQLDLKENLLPANARLQALVGGSKISLNIRLARHVVGQLDPAPLSAARLRNHYAKLLAQQDELTRYDRQRTDDEEIRSFIFRQLDDNAKAKKTPLLRRFRDQGQACEQSRFAALYESCRQERSA